MHYPGDVVGFALPNGTLEGGILFFILSYGMSQFVTFASQLMNMVVTNMMMNVTSLEPFGTGIGNTVESVFGLDRASQQNLMNIRHKQAQKQQEDLMKNKKDGKDGDDEKKGDKNRAPINRSSPTNQ